jgi:hypothetical protein
MVKVGDTLYDLNGKAFKILDINTHGRLALVDSDTPLLLPAMWNDAALERIQGTRLYEYKTVFVERLVKLLSMGPPPPYFRYMGILTQNLKT